MLNSWSIIGYFFLEERHLILKQCDPNVNEAGATISARTANMQVQLTKKIIYGKDGYVTQQHFTFLKKH